MQILKAVAMGVVAVCGAFWSDRPNPATHDTHTLMHTPAHCVRAHTHKHTNTRHGRKALSEGGGREREGDRKKETVEEGQ
jgi:hypothetical protein